MKRRYSHRINPYPEKGDAFLGVGCLLGTFLGMLLPIFLFILLNTYYVFLLSLIPPLLFWVIGRPFFDDFLAYRNRDDFIDLSLKADARVVDKWIGDDHDMNGVVIEFEANTFTKGRYLQKLTLNVRDAFLFSQIQVGNTVVVQYSRQNPRIAILEGEL